jgi:hypothetical protein
VVPRVGVIFTGTQLDSTSIEFSTSIVTGTVPLSQCSKGDDDQQALNSPTRFFPTIVPKQQCNCIVKYQKAQHRTPQTPAQHPSPTSHFQQTAPFSSPDTNTKALILHQTAHMHGLSVVPHKHDKRPMRLRLEILRVVTMNHQYSKTGKITVNRHSS